MRLNLNSNRGRENFGSLMGAGIGIGLVAGALAEVPDLRDREAILAMAGTYEVDFTFEETVGLVDGYELREGHHSEAKELVLVVEAGERRIVLQHLLAMGGERVVKHWKQVWTYEDDEITEYLGGGKWRTRELGAGEVAGTWSQLVTQVDDSPRYESWGNWEHGDGVSSWSSRRTWRPLPRREHTTRDDYQVLEAFNRHTITPMGWAHHQDNVKLVLEGDGGPYPLAMERGFNLYRKVGDEGFDAARAYWADTRAYWAEVSRQWEGRLAAGAGVSVTEQDPDRPLYRAMFDLAKEVRDGGEVGEGRIAEVLAGYVSED